MVDDFEVPNDSGYGFDDYGPGKSLTLQDFPLHRDRRMAFYVPARSSAQESGLNRGAIVLLCLNLKNKIDVLHTLIPMVNPVSGQIDN
jgi:hypothetical protein